MWLHPDPDQALTFAVRLCAVGQLVGLLELAIVRAELAGSGFLDWTMIGNLSPRTRTRSGSAIRRWFRRLPARWFMGLVAVDAVAAAALLARPATPALIALVIALQVALLKRHHMTIDGSDQMMLVVLVACLLGRIGADAVSTRAAASFLAAELALAYAVAGFAKAASSQWRSGVALPIIAQTRMYGHPRAARVMRRHPAVGLASGWSVIAWESLFVVTLTAPPRVVIAMLLLGLGFHLGCAVVMGLNRFLWAFAAGYAAVLTTNSAIRGLLGATSADWITIAVLALGTLMIMAVGGARSTGSRAAPTRRGPPEARLPLRRLRLRGEQGIAQQHRDRHRPDAARHGRDQSGDLGRGPELDVADEPCIGAVDADVDHRGAGLDPAALDHLRAADRGYQNIGAATDLGEISRPRMADRDRRVLSEQQGGDRLTHQV
jgi:hypothetical protein